jgi:hypothetical protein
VYHLRAAFDEEVALVGVLVAGQNGHRLEFAFVLIYLQHIPVVSLLCYCPNNAVFRAWKDFTLAVLEHFEVDLIPFCLPTDHLYRIAATKHT